MRTNGSAGPVLDPDLIPPPPERAQHGAVRRLDKQIADSRGGIGVPFSVETTLTRMHAIGRISADMAHAGSRFHSDFVRAHLLGIGAKASDFLRPPVGTTPRHQDDQPALVYVCREKVWGAITTCGGMASPCGSCAWNVLGLELTVKEWCTSRYTSVRIPEVAAPGVLVATLGELSPNFGDGVKDQAAAWA
jgi:hypothetical protein